MKAALLIFQMLCAMFIASAQSISIFPSKTDYMDITRKDINEYAYVYADVAYIRDSPSTKGLLKDSLHNGEIVKIIGKDTSSTTIRGLEGPWHKISYQKNGNEKEGYIWMGLLALVGSKDTNNNIFIHGLHRKIQSTETTPSITILEIKCLDQNLNVIAKDTLHAYLDDQSTTDYRVLSNMGLDGIEHIFRIGFLGEACGVFSYHYYFGWNGSKFIKFPSKGSMGDAGLYYISETILFPIEHNLTPNMIIRDTEEGEVIDEMASEYKYKKKRWREKFLWDGNKLSKVQ